MTWRGGRYVDAELTNVYTGDDLWVGKVLAAVREKVGDPQTMRALGFGASIAHCEFLAERFNRAGITARAVSANSSPGDRDDAFEPVAAVRGGGAGPCPQHRRTVRIGESLRRRGEPHLHRVCSGTSPHPPDATTTPTEGDVWEDRVMRIVVAEDNNLLRQGLTQLLEATGEIEVVGACADAAELLATVDSELPDAVLTDIRMPPTHLDEGIRAALEIRRLHPSIGVVVLSQYASPTYAVQLLGAEASGVGYLVKDRVADITQVIAALRTVSDGGSVLDSEVITEMLAARSVVRSSLVAELTERELEVLEAMAQGLSNGAIATTVHAAERTVEKYISSIFSKLQLVDEPDVNRRVRAVVLYLSEVARSDLG